MKAAFFTDTYLPHTDGVVRGIVGLRSALQSRGNIVLVFAPKAPSSLPLPQKNHFYFRSLPLPSYPQYRAAIFPFAAIKAIKAQKVQLVHSHSPATMGLAALHAAKENRLPSVFSFHTFFSSATHYVLPTAQLQNAAGRALWHYVSAYASQFGATTVPSNLAKKALQAHSIHSIVFPLGIDTHKFTPDSKDEKLLCSFGIPRGAKTILSLGRIAQEKNLEVLLHAAPLLKKEHPEAYILIAGKGPHLQALRKKASSLGITSFVKFAGFVPEKKIVPLYCSADAFAFPSLFETQGLAAIESLACATPAVGAKNSACEDIIKNNSNGILCGANAEEFASSLSRVLDSPQKYRAAARKSSLRFDVSKRADAMLSLYKKLL